MLYRKESGTGLTTTYSYFGNTGDQRLQEILNAKSGANMSKFDYTYNAVGTIATWTQQADNSTAVVNTLSYDNADQLVNAVQSGGATASNAYYYDPAGNRLAEVIGGGTTTTVGQFNNLNQLKALTSSATAQTVAGHTSAAVTSATIDAVPATISNATNFTANVPMPSGTNVVSVVAQPTSATGSTTTQRVQIVATGSAPTALTYDSNGNVLTDESGNTYLWDALNRLTKITYPSTAYSTFAYDGLSRRVQIAEYDNTHTLTVTRNLLWIGQAIAEQRNASNAVQTRYFPQGEQQTGTPYYYTRDHLGSIREMCDGSGNIIVRRAYDPYGRVTTTHPNGGYVNASLGYTGDYYHSVSGLCLTMYRAYDANTGRWLSRDPLGNQSFALTPSAEGARIIPNTGIYLSINQKLMGVDAETGQGPNLYGYVGEQPLRYTDRLGLYRDCDAELLACYRSCLKKRAPWPWENSDQSPAANRNGRQRYCDSACMPAYMACKASNGAERVCQAGKDLASYCASHPGTCVVIGGVTIIIVVQPETAPVLAPAL